MTNAKCLRCDERDARGENGIGFDPHLCEKCNIELQLLGQQGVEDDDNGCVICGEPKENGSDSTLCRACREKSARKYGWFPVHNPWCAKCHKHPRRKGVDSVLCVHCARQSLALKLEIRQAIKAGITRESEEAVFAFVPASIDKRGQAKMF